jgi:hypothetical protein
MRRILTFSFCAFAVGSCLFTGANSRLAAQEDATTTLAPLDPMPGSENEKEQSWYREQAPKSDALAIVQQKAQIRAQQRMDRLASMQWYGMSGSRPQSLATPFSSRYGSLWEMPGGKPYSWYPYARPGYVMYWR